MSGSRWVITPVWLSGSWRSFLYNSSVYSCHFFLISSAYIKSIPFLSFIETILAWNVPLVSLISLKRSLVFHILLFSSISLHWSVRKAFLSLLDILWNLHSNGYIFHFHSEGSNKSRAHQDPGIPQRLRQNCVWVSLMAVWVGGALPQGQRPWVQQTWVWHKPS